MVEKTYKKTRGSPTPTLMRLQKVPFDIEVLEELSEIQLDILCKLCVDFMSRKEIAKSRNVSPQAIGKVIRKFRKEGIIDNFNRPNTDIKPQGSPTPKKGRGSSPDNPKNNKLFRLHGENMSAKILKTSPKYMKLIEKKSQFPIKGNKVMLHRRKVVIYSSTSFYDKDPRECERKSNDYWTNFYRILENELGIRIIMGVKTEIYQFRRHIGRINDPLAKNVIQERLYYRVVDDLGQERLIIDNSGNMAEHEATHKELCIDDIEKIAQYDLDIITKEHFKPSEISALFKKLTENFTYLQEFVGMSEGRQAKTEAHLEDTVRLLKEVLKRL